MRRPAPEWQDRRRRGRRWTERLGGGVPTEPPGAVPARCRRGGGGERRANTVLAQRGVASPASAPLHPGKAAQSPSSPSLQITQELGRLAEPEIAAPAGQIDRQPVDGLLQAHPSRAPCQAPHPAREPGQRQRRDPTPRFGFAGEAEAEELARRRARHRALGTVDRQLRCRVRKRSTLAMTRSPTRRLCTSMLQSPPSRGPA